MNLAGDQDVRIDMTNKTSQITGLDLNGNGSIANDGKENALDVHAATGYGAVDAYTRLTNGVVNETDLANVFLGDIKYDGTGFKGDGTSSNGNVVLGGLGADTILGGIGNDFLAAGGIALSHAAATESLSGGRNADFLFAELSLLSNTDGNKLFIDGGATADDTSAANGQSSQDSDWLLLQASDDDERIEVVLTENVGPVGTTPVPDGTLMTRAMQYATLRDIENLDASGNTYGFIKGLTAIGGAPVNANNNGIGSSGQLNVTGSSANNIIIGGYDNDAINGGAGNDILMGGNMKSYGADYRVALGANNVATQQLLDPNLVDLTGNNDGRDELIGGTGADNIAFEADGGIIEGGADQNVDDTPVDTLWLTANSLGAVAAAGSVTPVAAAALTKDGVVRIDLAVGKEGGLANAHGYGGADLDAATGNYTADQTNYNTANAGLRVQVQDMENVTATGLGAIDYKAAGGNSAADVTFSNQQNFLGYNGDLDLRGTYKSADVTTTTNAGQAPAAFNAQTPQNPVYTLDTSASVKTVSADGTVTTTVTPVKASGGAIVGTQTVVTTAGADGANILYAGTGNDVIEGRTGGAYTFNGDGSVVADTRDKLSGNDGIDTFIFGTMDGNSGSVSGSGGEISSTQASYGDNIDVIWRQSDVNAADVLAGKGADNLWDGVSYERDFGIGSSTSKTASGLKLTLNVSAADTVSNPLVANDVREIDITVAGTAVVLTTAGMAAAVTMADLLIEVQSALTTHADANLTASLSNNTITIADASGRVLGGSGYIVAQASGGSIQNTVTFQPTLTNTVGDVILYTSYEDRLDAELTNDSSFNGSTISLGEDSYAQDRVVSFSDNNGKIQTRIAEDQSYTLTFNNLTTQDTVTITVNGVQYQLTVGKDLDGSSIAEEDGRGDTQASIQTHFLGRLDAFINSFMDRNTAAGQVASDYDNASTITLSQAIYTDGEQTVFMKEPIVTLGNGSGGQPATVVLANTAQHEVLLYEYDGRDNGLNATNVKFIGSTGVNQSTLETAKSAGQTLIGNEAVVVDGNTDDLVTTVTNNTDTYHAAPNLAALTAAQAPVATIANNTNTNADLNTNFAVHGDDLLIGGAGNDTIYGRTGDDRVHGSLGTDTVDGGKDWYAVRVLNEAQSRVVEMNSWEAASPAARVAALAGLNVTGIAAILQTQDGQTVLPKTANESYFNDTLMFQQADFDAANTRFTITLDDFSVAAGVVSLKDGGAGHVGVDVAGDGVLDVGQVTTFTNFENIRTVSGSGLAVAGNGQGNDTLNVAALSTATGGISYDLTNSTTTQGEVKYSTNAHASLLRPTSTLDGTSDFETLVMRVDGVEHVIAGLGDDLLMIGENEAAKNNNFSADLGDDRIEYQNKFDTLKAEPTVTIKVNTSTDVDQVVMTGGRVAAAGAAGATDTLTSVEFITLAEQTAQGLQEDDVLDVTAMATGAVVDYTNGQVRTGLAVGSGVQVTVENIQQMENVWADGNDTVIVADHSVMSTNARSDELVTANDPLTEPAVIQLSTYFDFDDLKATAGTTTQTYDRKSFTAQVADDTATYVINQNQFTFDMSRVGVDADFDTIDYSNETGQITAVMNFVGADTKKYVIVGSPVTSGGLNNVDGLTADGTRVDRLVSVERIVAAAGANSTIDLVNSDRDVNVVFSYNMPDAKANFVEQTATTVGNMVTALDRQINTVRVSDANNQSALGNVDLLEYRDLGNLVATVALPDQARATWESVQGSDKREYVQLTQWEDGINHVFNLRGGQNEVNYNERTNGIELQIVAVDGEVDGVASQFSLKAFQLDENGVKLNSGNSFDTIYGYNTANTFNETAGARVDAMRIEASQGFDDRIDVSLLGSGIYLLGEVETSGSSVVTATFDGKGQGLVMSGFEFLVDGPKDDTYTINDLTNFVSKLTLIDTIPAPADRDTIKLSNGAFEASTLLTIDNNLHMGDANANDLQRLGVNPAGNALGVAGSVGFDFRVLDISTVNATASGGSLAGLITAAGSAAGTTDELIVGNLALLDSTTATAITNFDILSLTGAGGSYDLDLTAGQLQTAANVKIVGFTDVETLDVSRTTSGNTITVTGAAATVVGSAFADTITGGAGNDFITGGAGADLLDGGFVAEKAEVQKFVLSGNWGTAGVEGVSANSDSAVTFDGFTVTENTTVRGTLVPAGANAGQIGSAIVREWLANPAAFGNSAAISSITYDTGTQAIVVTYKTTGLDISNALLTVVDTAGTDANTLSIGAASITEWVARAESNDTFVYLKAADSTAAAMDVISNFTIDGTAGTNDIIDISAITNATMGAMSFADAFDYTVTAQTSYAVLSALAADAFAAAALSNVDANVTWGFAGSTGTATVGDSYLFLDADQNGTIDSVVKLAGVANDSFIAGGFDSTNINYL